MFTVISKKQLPIYGVIGDSSTRDRQLNYSDETKDLPAFVTRSTGWLRPYQLWSKKRDHNAQRKFGLPGSATM